MEGKAGWVVAAALLAGACDEPSAESRPPALDAYCEASIAGVGRVDVETDYLPHVINCETAATSFEALKAQAIAARSYLYYKLGRTDELGGTGEVTDGAGDQVYTCGREPSVEHHRAVDATSGQVLRYRGTQVAAFYVAGALQNPPTCIAGPEDPTHTERYVTDNLGKAGGHIDQTPLGFVAPSNLANRGCMSQNGAACLAGEGFDAVYMMRFYYGEDIELVTAQGPCVLSADAGVSGGDDGFVGGCGAGLARSLAGGLVLVLLFLAHRRITIS